MTPGTLCHIKDWQEVHGKWPSGWKLEMDINIKNGEQSNAAVAQIPLKPINSMGKSRSSSVERSSISEYYFTPMCDMELSQEETKLSDYSLELSPKETTSLTLREAPLSIQLRNKGN